MRQINPFYVQKTRDSIAEKVKNASWLKKGTLLIEVHNGKQAELLLKAALLGSNPMYTERHSSLNSFRGVVSTYALDGMSDDKIQCALAEQSVSSAYRLTGKLDGKHLPQRSIFLTFEVSSLPSHIRDGYESVSVRPYIRNPMRCFRCQKFGHTQQRCASHFVCTHCGESGHSDEPCPYPPTASTVRERTYPATGNALFT
jgi:hypothetical protein